MHIPYWPLPVLIALSLLSGVPAAAQERSRALPYSSTQDVIRGLADGRDIVRDPDDGDDHEVSEISQQPRHQG